MNQLALSTDITVITAEINSFKQVAGQAVFEIGKRLKHVKENDLVHGEWFPYLETIEISTRTAQSMIQAFERFGNTQSTALLPTGKIFEMLSLPKSVDADEFLETPHVIPSTGEEKTVNEMTQLQLREVTKQLKQSELQAKQLETKYTLAINQHSEQQDKLLTQIDELKKSKTKDSPETLKRIAELEEKADREHQLAMDNIRLQLDMKNMERDFAEKITQRDKETQAYSDLRKSLRSIINIVTMENSNAKQQYRLISGHKEANEAIQDFINRFDPLVQELFKTWREAATLEEVNANAERTGTTTNSRVVEIGSGEG